MKLCIGVDPQGKVLLGDETNLRRSLYQPPCTDDDIKSLVREFGIQLDVSAAYL